MKILHTSDWHLGIAINGFSMIPDQKHFIDKICDIISQKSIDAVIIAGDIFDTGVSNSEAIKLFDYAMKRICSDLGKKVFVVAGNHDSGARLSTHSELLSSAGLFIKGRINADLAPIETDDADFYFLPFFNTDEAKAVFPDEEISNLTDAYCVVTEKIKENMNHEKANIAITHSFITGAQTGDTERFAALGNAANVACEVFDGFDYCAAGHIHKLQTLGKCTYSGTPMKMSFSEAGQDKGVVIFDTETGKTEFEPLTPLHEMKIIRGDITEVLDSAVYCDDYIKIELTDGFAGLELQHRLREFYPNLMMITSDSHGVEGDEISLKVSDIETIPPEKIAESFFEETLGEKLTDSQMDMLLEALREVEQ